MCLCLMSWGHILTHVCNERIRKEKQKTVTVTASTIERLFYNYYHSTSHNLSRIKTATRKFKFRNSIFLPKNSPIHFIAQNGPHITLSIVCHSQIFVTSYDLIRSNHMQVVTLYRAKAVNFHKTAHIHRRELISDFVSTLHQPICLFLFCYRRLSIVVLCSHSLIEIGIVFFCFLSVYVSGVLVYHNHHHLIIV